METCTFKLGVTQTQVCRSVKSAAFFCASVFSFTFWCLGVPGELSSSGLQKEDALSAATLIAPVKKPGFNGIVEYTSNGDVKPGIDVRVFTTGQRNPFDVRKV